MLREIQNNREKVTQILKDHAVTRDCDKLLWLAFMVKHRELKKQLGNESYSILRRVLLDKSTPSMESLRRVRQKVQEEGLYRGALYEKRHKESEKVKDFFRGE